jgi:hypothetical protein
MVNPRDFLPGPFSNATVRNVQCELVLVRRGKVQKFEVVFIFMDKSSSIAILMGSTVVSQIFSFDCDFSLSLSSSQRFKMLMAHGSGLSNLLKAAAFDRRGFFMVLNFVSFFSILRETKNKSETQIDFQHSPTHIATISDTIELRFGAESSELCRSLRPSIERFRNRFVTKLDEDVGDNI